MSLNGVAMKLLGRGWQEGDPMPLVGWVLFWYAQRLGCRYRRCVCIVGLLLLSRRHRITTLLCFPGLGSLPRGDRVDVGIHDRRDDFIVETEPD